MTAKVILVVPLIRMIHPNVGAQPRLTTKANMLPNRMNMVIALTIVPNPTQPFQVLANVPVENVDPLVLVQHKLKIELLVLNRMEVLDYVAKT